MKILLDNLKDAFGKSSWKRGYNTGNVFTIYSCEYGGFVIDTHSHEDICQVHLNIAVSNGYMARNFISYEDPTKRKLMFNLYGWILSFLRQFENIKAMMESFGFECHSFHVYEYGDLKIFLDCPSYSRKGIMVSFEGNSYFIPLLFSPLKALVVYGRSRPDRYMNLPQKVRDLVLSGLEIKKECRLEVCYEV